MLGWSGMRGAITLAALLAVPRTAHGGSALAGRDDIIYLGFAVIIVSVIAQGLSLPILVRRLGLVEHPAVTDVERRARLTLTNAVLEFLEEAQARGTASPELIEGVRAQYGTRREHLEGADRLRRAEEIGITTQRVIERELDLEDELRTRAFTAPAEVPLESRRDRRRDRASGQ